MRFELGENVADSSMPVVPMLVEPPEVLATTKLRPATKAIF